MQKRTGWINTLLFVAFLLGEQVTYGQEIERKLQLTLLTGVQHEDFNWSIAGNTNGQDPNVFSELKWKNVGGQTYIATAQWNVWKHIWLYADYDRVVVHSGALSDMDYAADNRALPTYSANFSDNKGNTTAFNLGVGYSVFSNEKFRLIPFAGYSNNSQNLYIVDLSGQFPDLNSSYFAHWQGEFVKVRSSLKIIKQLTVAADITYSQVNYTAEGDWNLITQFQHPLSYSHIANGYGITANTDLILKLTANIAVKAGYGYFKWETGTGNDYAYLQTGAVDKTQLNGVSRNGYQLTAGIGLTFK